MKKRFLILLAALLFAAGCANGTAGGTEAVFVDPNAVRGGEYGTLYFEANGVRFGIYDETEQVLASLPREIAEPYVEKSCAFESEDVIHFFEGFEITANEIDGTSRITGIRITSDLVSTPQGLTIGMREADAKAAFAALYEAGWNLVDGTAQLSVVIGDGVVKEIVYGVAPQGN